MLAGLIHKRRSPIRLIGVGGIFSAADVQSRLDAGAHHAQLATAAMLDPLAGIKIRNDLPAATRTVKTSELAKNLQPLSK